MQSMKPAEYKHLLLSLKKKIKKIRKTIKQEIGESNKILEESNKKLEEWNKKIKELEDKIKKKTWIGKSNHPIKTERKLLKTFYQITKNEKHTIKNKTDKN